MYRDFSIFKNAYVITGGIGSGKSSVCAILHSLGYEIIDADKIAHGVLEERSNEVVQAFGEGILEEGRISRKKLGETVFADQKKLKLLNQILSPYIQEKLYGRCLKAEQEKRVYFVEIALLFEEREIYNFRHSVLIACSMEDQIRRVCERNGLEQEEIQNRINAQMPLEKKLGLAEFVLWNRGCKRELELEVKGFLSLLKSNV